MSQRSSLKRSEKYGHSIHSLQDLSSLQPQSASKKVHSIYRTNKRFDSSKSQVVEVTSVSGLMGAQKQTIFLWILE